MADRVVLAVSRTLEKSRKITLGISAALPNILRVLACKLPIVGLHKLSPTHGTWRRFFELPFAANDSGNDCFI